MTMTFEYLDPDYRGLSLAFGEKKYVMIFAILGVLIATLYMYMLPSLPDGVFIAPYAIQFITPVQEVFAVIFGILFSLVIVLNIYAFRMRTSSGKRLTAGSIFASLVNGLCCTPLIPTLIALSGASTPVLFNYSPRIQAFFEFNYQYFYLLSAVLLFVSVHYLSRNIYSCCKR